MNWDVQRPRPHHGRPLHPNASSARWSQVATGKDWVASFDEWNGSLPLPPDFIVPMSAMKLIGPLVATELGMWGICLAVSRSSLCWGMVAIWSVPRRWKVWDSAEKCTLYVLRSLGVACLLHVHFIGPYGPSISIFWMSFQSQMCTAIRMCSIRGMYPTDVWMKRKHLATNLCQINRTCFPLHVLITSEHRYSVIGCYRYC